MKKDYSKENDAVNIAVISEKVSSIEKKVDWLVEKMEKDFATKEWVDGKYGLWRTAMMFVLGIFGTAIVGFFASLVIRK